MARHVLTGERVAPPADVGACRAAQDTRERLLAAVPAALAAGGWPGLDPGHLCALAGVPAESFAVHFASEQACFLAAYRHHAGRVLEAVRHAEPEQPGPERVRAAFAALLGFLAAEPAVAELIVVRVLSAGPEALAERDRAADALSGLIAGRVVSGPGGRAAAGALRRTAGGAVAQLLYSWVAAGRAGELPQLLPTCTYLALVGSHEPEAAASLSGLEAAPA